VTSTDARAAILGRVRNALRTGRVPSAPTVRAAERPVEARADLAQRFLRQLEGVGVRAYVEMSDDAVRARVVSLVNGRSVFAWDPRRLPYGVAGVLTNAATGASPRDTQAAAQIGVTGCDAAIAETGSVVVLSGPGQPKAASLLPPAHLAIVRADELHASIGAFFESMAEPLRAAACCTFITGPSRTADIELTLTLGVHGPGEVIVVLGP